MSVPGRDETREEGSFVLETHVIRARKAPPLWHMLLAASSCVGFTHRPLWTDSLCRHLDGRRGLWLIVEADGEPLGGLALLETRRGPFRVVEGHYDGTCSVPLLADGMTAELETRVIEVLMAEFFDSVRSPMILTTALHMPIAWSDVLRDSLGEHGFTKRDMSVAVIPLDQGLDYVDRKILTGNRRNERNKSLRRGAVTGITCDPAIIDEFYPLYLDCTRRWGSIPINRNLLTDLLSEGSGSVFCTTIRVEGVLIGMYLNIVDGDMITAWLAATDISYNKKFFPSTLVVWASVEEACRRGAVWFDLGAHGGKAGVANFKRLIGAKTIKRGSYVRHSPGGYLWRGLRQLRRRLRF